MIDSESVQIDLECQAGVRSCGTISKDLLRDELSLTAVILKYKNH